MLAIGQSRVFMDTPVTIEVVSSDGEARVRAAIDTAFGWFAEVERVCSRFDPASELRRLCERDGEPVDVSPLLFRALEFALAVARDSGGAFEPTIGEAMERAGFDRNYRTGDRAAPRARPAQRATFRDIALEPRRSRVTLRRPLQLDLGGVAKGFAIDLAAQALAGFPGVAINAGGDIFARGRNGAGKPWRIGVRDPRDPAELLAVLDIADGAVCTSGDYERTAAGGHHILRPASGESATALASVTVVAPTAMLADALATAAFVLGPGEGLALVERAGVEGMLVTPAGERFETRGFKRYQK
ncbi:MAG: FAD:protein FMN transferase [Dehalococcoidia bacterium]|nr:FAD:protein FMN transferase [Dehalococcoidia bacterium]